MNQTNSLNMVSPVLLSVTPSTNVSIQVFGGNFIISGVKAQRALSFTSSSKRWCLRDHVIHSTEPSSCWNPWPQDPLRSVLPKNDYSFPPPIHSSTKDTFRVSYRSLSCLEVPVVWDLGEGTLQKTGILKFFYRSGKVCTRCVEHSSILHPWSCFLGRRGQLQCDKGIQDRVSSNNLSRLGQLWVIWTQNRSLGGQQVISSPVSLLTDLLGDLFSHLRIIRSCHTPPFSIFSYSSCIFICNFLS